MKTIKTIAVGLSIALTLASTAYAQSGLTPVIVEAESGILGADFAIETDSEMGITSIYPTNDHGDVGTATRPATDGRVTSFTVTFPRAGEYFIYARMANGPDQYSDDSFFLSEPFFGVKDPTADGDWKNCNGVAGAGFDDDDAVVGAINTVNGESVVDIGSADIHESFKWLNLSTWGACQSTAIVTAGALTQTFSYGARENGLWLDKIAFGLNGDLFTVADLNEGRAATGRPAKEPSPPMAEGKDKFLGSAFSDSQTKYFSYYFNQVTPENSGKWASIEATRDTMTWDALDAAYAQAKDNNAPFRMHVLVWGNQQPDWIENLTQEEQLAEIIQWFDAVAERYPDIDVLEVVNEPLHDSPAGEGNGNYIDALGGADNNAWIKTAFSMARERFPNAKLMINEYDVLNNATILTEYKAIITELQAESLVDIIGVQAHAFSTRGNSSQMKETLDTLAETGLPIHITEMDIDGNPAATALESDMTQLADYKRIFPIFWEHPAVEGVTLWGYRPGLWRDESQAYIMEADDDDRPAATWLRSYAQGVNQKPVIDTSGINVTVDEEILDGSTIVFLTADDPDGENESISNWTIIGGTGLGRFELDLYTGELYVGQGIVLDYETSPSYTIEVIAMDQHFEDSDPVTITVNLNDIENDGAVGDSTIWEPIKNKKHNKRGGSSNYLLFMLLILASITAYNSRKLKQ